ncbi:hypothetical protein KIPB_000358 [Kipferlia bialata]|uniref:Uncharacterized protein n=1 Tax=Kipferlia bialata TaxID=797122 RepID=A0A9K3CM71_9EUKA|nr:hypothetical protein KIPB_000358 [Kipferlia bialata]|eukprot:g358.t1
MATRTTKQLKAKNKKRYETPKSQRKSANEESGPGIKMVLFAVLAVCAVLGSTVIGLLSSKSQMNTRLSQRARPGEFTAEPQQMRPELAGVPIPEGLEDLTEEEQQEEIRKWASENGIEFFYDEEGNVKAERAGEEYVVRDQTPEEMEARQQYMQDMQALQEEMQEEVVEEYVIDMDEEDVVITV